MGVRIFFVGLVSLVLYSCSDSSLKNPEENVPEPRLLLPDAETAEDADIPILSTIVPDASIPLPSEEYQNRCWKSQFWHCPPFDEVWRVEVVVDICNEDGVPCEPQGIADPNCEWTLVSEGECSQYSECDPANIGITLQPCQSENDAGEVVAGQQEVRCSKGSLVRGPCIACQEEACDSTDNDCDGMVDEGFFPCQNSCGEGVATCPSGTLENCTAPEPEEEVCDELDNDCDGQTDEGQLNACDQCGEVPADICDGEDNDCDGRIDEELVQLCQTVCGEGIEICVSGDWLQCTARQPTPEVCDSEDNDCDGLVDEGLECNCPPQILGALLPCLEPPLACGQGFKMCECATEECLRTSWTECRPMCVWMEENPCDLAQGMAVDEICNGYDDNCNNLIDEELVRDCYSGPPDTLNVGMCSPGIQSCESGQWGGHVNGVHVPDICIDEVTPTEEICNGEDDNCDGVVEEDLDPTDILFIVDVSGSMREEIRAAQGAMTAFAASFQGSPNLRWGLIAGPTGPADKLSIITNLVPFDQFIPALGGVRETTTSEEMLKDALYLSVRNLAPFNVIPQDHIGIRWDEVEDSVPTLDNFRVNWRANADRVIILLTDEEAQTFLEPKITNQILVDILNQIPRLSVHVFSTLLHRDGGNSPWGPLTIGGSHHELTSNQEEMFGEMMRIIDEEVCGNGQN